MSRLCAVAKPYTLFAPGATQIRCPAASISSSFASYIVGGNRVKKSGNSRQRADCQSTMMSLRSLLSNGLTGGKFILTRHPNPYEEVIAMEAPMPGGSGGDEGEDYNYWKQY